MYERLSVTLLTRLASQTAEAGAGVDSSLGKEADTNISDVNTNFPSVDTLSEKAAADENFLICGPCSLVMEVRLKHKEAFLYFSVYDYLNLYHLNKQLQPRGFLEISYSIVPLNSGFLSLPKLKISSNRNSTKSLIFEIGGSPSSGARNIFVKPLDNFNHERSKSL